MKRIFIAITIISFTSMFIRVSAQKKKIVKSYYEEFGIAEFPDSLYEEAAIDSSRLKLNDAILIALANNPKLKAIGMEISAFQAAALQAKSYPNPEIGIELENFLGSGIFNGLGGSENTFYITQNFVLGNKLSTGRDVELLKSDLASWNLEKERINLITEVRKSFIIISSLQHQNKLNKQLLQLSLDFQKDLERRIRAGKVSPAEVVRASLISTSLEIEIQNKEMEYASQIQHLKSLLGKHEIKFNSVENICNLKYDIPKFSELRRLIVNSPNLAPFKTDLKRAEKEVLLQEAISTPDLSVSVGYRRINETSDNVMIMGASMPINIFNNNSGNIERAKIKVDQTKYNYKSTINSSEARLSLLINNINGFETMIEKLETESLPKAREAFEIISEGNLVGRFTVLDVLDSQRSLYELESQFVNAVADYNRNIIELEALTLTKFNFEYKARILENE